MNKAYWRESLERVDAGIDYGFGATIGILVALGAIGVVDKILGLFS
jgi:hypothetical protein